MRKIYHYKDFYGNRISITIQANGNAILKCWYGGKCWHNKKYASERGAKIALGRICDFYTLVKAEEL